LLLKTNIATVVCDCHLGKREYSRLKKYNILIVWQNFFRES